jgi:seryl-tRNA(Sec) selenium transferase
VIIQKAHRNPFDHQLRATGVKLVVIETREELHNAVGPKTAMMHFTNFANAAGQIKVEEWLKLAKQYNLPTMIDAAADTPPVSHLWDYTKMGYDMITFSGGKAMRGPQCAGLLIGRKEMVRNALLNNSPFEDTLGRGQKVGKEEIVGMIKALEIYLNEDHEALTKEWWSRLDKISADVTKVPGVSTAYFVPDIANHVPHVQINWDPRRISLAPREAAGLLRKGTPSIVVESTETGLAMNSFMLQPGEDAIVGPKIAELLRAHPV